MKKYVALKQASQLLDRSPDELQKLCQSGFMDAKIVGSEWFVNVDKKIGPTSSTPGRVTDLRQAMAMILILLLFSVGLAQMAQISLPNLPPPVAQVSASDILAGWLEELTYFFSSLPTKLDLLRDRLVANWQRFLGVAPPVLVEPVAVTPEDLPPMPTNTPSLTSTEIQKLIDERVAAQLRQLSRSISTAGGGSANSGLVVVPSTGDDENDQVLRQRIDQAFSDRVVVSFDPSGLTGIITPIFRRVAGDNYLFLLTPVRQ